MHQLLDQLCLHIDRKFPYTVQHNPHLLLHSFFTLYSRRRRFDQITLLNHKFWLMVRIVFFTLRAVCVTGNGCVSLLLRITSCLWCVLKFVWFWVGGVVPYVFAETLRVNRRIIIPISVWMFVSGYSFFSLTVCGTERGYHSPFYNPLIYYPGGGFRWWMTL